MSRPIIRWFVNCATTPILDQKWPIGNGGFLGSSAKSIFAFDGIKSRALDD
jgi:hypothetical protein